MNNNENEVLTNEEREQLNNRLLQAEKLELPQSLSTENIEKLINDNSNIVPIATNKKKSSRKKWGWIASVAAMLVVAFTSLAFIQPWQKIPVKNNEEPEDVQQVQYDYSEIEGMFTQYAKEYKRVTFREGLTGIFTESFKYEYAVVEDSAASLNGGAAPSATTGVGASHGETNEQVEGVSEADIIKNDGRYIYVVSPDNADWDSFYSQLDDDIGLAKTTEPVEPEAEAETQTETAEATEKTDDNSYFPEVKYSCSVSIIEPKKNGEMSVVATVGIAPEDDVYYMNIQEMYVSGNNIIVLLNCDVMPDDYNRNTFFYGYDNASRSMAVCIDVSDVKSPVEKWRVYQDGGYISSRLIGNQLVLLSQYGVDITKDEKQIIDDCIPTYGYNGCDCMRIIPDDIYIMENINDSTYLVASSVDISNSETLKTKAVLGAGSNVYCNTEFLYATSTTYESGSGYANVFGGSEQTTEIHKFDIRNNNIEYIGKGSVKGHALNQFSMDEYNGYLRIATTNGDWGEGLENQLYVLDNNLNVVGKIEGIAKGETIKSVRFSGDTGYVVTFEQTDPLFVIDLKDPYNPVIKGELKIPGFSTYLHPVGDGLVMGVGVDGDENGQNDGMKVSLFDVSNPEKPVECDKLVVSATYNENQRSYVYSDAYYNHKALCYDKTSNTMYIPYKIEVSDISTYGEDYRIFGCIIGVGVDLQNKKLVTTTESMVRFEEDYYYPGGLNRVTYVDDVVYGYSSDTFTLYSFDKASGDSISMLQIK